ncbi:uncharacterized protein LOC111540651 isoform X2 [Piliocolobus tephrosceles]|uniref:uncharacterized protein LOC111540651 isoform X2 n=1 Tax=Piliocolobus tephrosceles TaxID=591936 RepID=UPI00130127D4|nr:uncharacterized protein LOC111540651 isoform X2 [Piliocolobus tephrosceles]
MTASRWRPPCCCTESGLGFFPEEEPALPNSGRRPPSLRTNCMGIATGPVSRQTCWNLQIMYLTDPSRQLHRQPDVQRSIRVEEEELAGTSGDHPRAEQTIHGQNDAEFGPGSRKRAQGKPFPFWVPHLLRATSTQ